MKLKQCKCGGMAHLHKTSRGKFLFECGSCWTQSNKFGSIYEAMIDWNKRVENDLEE